MQCEHVLDHHRQYLLMAYTQATLNGVDSRPSDALNLALRSSAKIFVHRQVRYWLM